MSVWLLRKQEHSVLSGLVPGPLLTGTEQGRSTGVQRWVDPLRPCVCVALCLSGEKRWKDAVCRDVCTVDILLSLLCGIVLCVKYCVVQQFGKGTACLCVRFVLVCMGLLSLRNHLLLGVFMTWEYGVDWLLLSLHKKERCTF